MVYFAVQYINKRLKTGRSVELGEMMSRHGLDMKTVIDRGLEVEIVSGARACMACDHYDECADRMKKTEKPEYCDICPNAYLLDNLKPQT
ncbi:MAG: DUF6455 family protein [Magnetospiraceae bacterium]